jgi:transposase-like protein
MLDSVRETVGLSQAPGRLQATPNRRNGRYPKQVTTEYDEVALAIPRDRKRSFTPVVVPPHQTTRVGLEDHVIARYARG